ncbi:hypothetical protein EDB83DRAFT_2323095 [Lactarius deliciosus]|nr:hypothetical protein EDB83DRAFT_2323095 [Lactarius deliciosus]
MAQVTPRYFWSHPYPTRTKPVPVITGMGFIGFGCGFKRVARVRKPVRVVGSRVYSATALNTGRTRRGGGGGRVEMAPVQVEVRGAGGSRWRWQPSRGGGVKVEEGRVEVAAAWQGRGGGRSRVGGVEGSRGHVGGGVGQSQGVACAHAGVTDLRLRRSCYARWSGRSCSVEMSKNENKK